MKGTFAALSVVVILAACADPAPAKAPATSASAAPLPLPGDPPQVDASLIDPKEAGSSSDCIPAAPPGDGDVDEAILGATQATLSICMAYHAPMAEAPAGRACYEVDLAQGRFDRVAPFGPPQVAPDPLAARLAQHDSNGFTLKQSGTGAISICKGEACESLTPDGYKPLAMHEACIPAALASNMPAAMSPDGTTLFVARHEACDATHVFGETYDVKQKRRTARFPLKTDAIIDDAAWLGARVMVRACTADMQVCAVSMVDPKAPAAPQPHGFANAAVVAGVNPAGLDPYYVHGTGDLFGFVDRLGGNVAFVHADTGNLERAVALPPSQDMRRPIAVAATPAKLLVVYGGMGRVAVVDLATMAQTAQYRAPICGERW
jgi:hypothetical protein